jgi:hypothetical protein
MLSLTKLGREALRNLKVGRKNKLWGKLREKFFMFFFLSSSWE